MKKLKKIPKFKTEAEESKFWQRVDSTEYVDYSKMERWVFPNLKLTSSPITIRIPDSLLDRVKMRAHKKDIPYQTLIKQFIYEGLS
ncbi:MAG: CopG family antitoxin [Patescibacteria group bacterium]